MSGAAGKAPSKVIAHHRLMKARQAAAHQALLESIARTFLLVETLAERGSDRLDFHEVNVTGIQRALQAAFDAGRRSAL